MSKKPVVLMILDGYGLNEQTKGNAVKEAKTPVMDKLMKEYPFVRGNASGMAETHRCFYKFNRGTFVFQDKRSNIFCISSSFVRL